MLRWGCRSGERLFEKGDAHTFRAADFLERGQVPRLALHHVRKQGQPHRDDLAILGQARDGLIEKGVLLRGKRAFR